MERIVKTSVIDRTLEKWNNKSIYKNKYQKKTRADSIEVQMRKKQRREEVHGKNKEASLSEMLPQESWRTNNISCSRIFKKNTRMSSCCFLMHSSLLLYTFTVCLTQSSFLLVFVPRALKAVTSPISKMLREQTPAWIHRKRADTWQISSSIWGKLFKQRLGTSIA